MGKEILMIGLTCLRNRKRESLMREGRFGGAPRHSNVAVVLSRAGGAEMKNRKIVLVVLAIVSLARLLPAQTRDAYKVFNDYLEAAKRGVPYTGAPLEGKVVAFGNALSVLPFCALVERGIKEQLALFPLFCCLRLLLLRLGWIDVDHVLVHGW